jgi:predicted nucleic acid-binding protein
LEKPFQAKRFTDFGPRPFQDVLILAEAERLGVTAVATLDRDCWHRVKEFDVYTVPA